MRFTYKALYEGVVKTGKIEAFSEREVVDYLRNNNFFPIEIKVVHELVIPILSGLTNGVGENDIISYTRQIAIMLNVGLTLSSCHEILMEQASKMAFRDLLNEINNNIKQGESYSTSLAHHPQHFYRLYVALVKAGEASGKLNIILSKLADDMEKQREFKAKLKGAMLYPVIVLLGVIGVVFVLMTVVVPQLLGLFRDLGADLPLATQVLITLSDFSVKSLPFVIPGGLIGGYILRKQLATETGQYWMYSLLMRLPVFGQIITIGTLVMTTRTLSLLLGSGVLVLDSMGIVIGVTSNKVFQRALQNVYENIQKGLTISQSLEKEHVFPPILIQMSAVGERTGKLDEMFLRISDYFESESNIAIKTLTTAIEPIVLIVLGGIVLFIVMAVLSPIYTLTNQIGK